MLHFLTLSFCFYLFISPFLLFSENRNDYEGPSEVVSTEGLPSNLVNQSVCVISGEYTDSIQDLLLPGPEPLVLQRFYSNFSRGGTIGTGWNFNHYENIVVGSAHHREEGPIYVVYLRQTSGALLDYIHPNTRKFKEKDKVRFDFVSPKGLTNGAGSLSGKTNIKNQKVDFYPQEKKIVAISGDGNQRTFLQSDTRGVYNQKSEEKANGFLYLYRKSKRWDRAIVVKNKKTGLSFSRIGFKNHESSNGDHVFSVESGDGRKINYFYKGHKYTIRHDNERKKERAHHIQHCLTKVENPSAPTEEYEYGDKALNKQLQIIAKKRPEGRFLLTEYYHKGRNRVRGEESIDIKEDDDYRLDRVKKQKAPVGHDERPITTHRYVYDCKVKKHRDGHKTLGEGATEVFDALGHKSRYAYDDVHRLSSITRYSGTGHYHHYCKEEFLWDKEGSLKAKIFKDDHGAIHHARYFRYDERGNVIQSILCGKLTGNESPLIVFDKKNKRIENGYERETKTYEYSNDGLNLCLQETDSQGKTTRYEYLHGTDILTRKYIVVDGEIILREFYFYDGNYILGQKITDDGKGIDPDDLTGASERHFTFINPRQTQPLGLPESSEECYWDFPSGQKRTIRSSRFDYSPEGRLLKQEVYDNEGRHAYTLHWEYDAHGNLTRETNALGEATIKRYDANDNLIFEQGPSGTIIENTYDFANRLIRQEEIHPDGQRFSIHHTYDYLNHCIASTDAYGHETKKSYDDFGRVISVHYPAVPVEDGSLVHGIVKTEYDIAGYPISILDAKGRSTRTEYNIRGQPTEITHPDGTTESWRYELDGQLKEHRSKTGIRTHYSRDPLGRVTQEALFAASGELLKTTTHRYNALHLLETTDSEGVSLFYDYDCSGKLIGTRQEGRRIQNFYDSLGRLSEIREWFGEGAEDYRATFKVYDLLDRVVEERIQSADGKVLHLSRSAYDVKGNKTLTQVGDVKTWTEYDGHNNPIKITNNLGQTTHTHYDTHFINPHGQRVLQTTTTDPLGYQTIDTYDTASRLAQTSRKNPFGQIISNQSIFYDLCGNKCRVVDDVMEEGQAVRKIETIFNYNVGNQLTAIIEAAGTPEQKITRTHYNSLGQKSALVKPDGNTLNYEYDALGRVKTFRSADDSISCLYEYNSRDQVVRVTDFKSNQTTERTYDRLGQMVEEMLGNGLTMKYSYDLTGRTKKIIYPDGSSVDYFYDAADLKEVRRTKEGEVVYTHADEVHSLTGQVERSRPPGQNGTVEYAYDPLGRIIKIESSHFCQTVPADGFDAAGNLLKFETQGLPYQFSYDDHYHIQSEEGHTRHTYKFDSLSNRIAKDGEAHHHNHLNFLLQKGEEKFIYDANGNRTQRVSGDQVTQYSYDALDRLIAVEQDGAITRYAYDPFNRRLSKTGSDEQEEFFLYQGQEEIGRYCKGKLQELRLIGKNQRSCTIAIEIDGVPHVPLYDISGNVVALLTIEGQVIERYRYTVFGEAEILSPAGEKREASLLGNPWQYAGKRVDEETGLSAFGLRYYDSAVGRWLTPDPAGFADGPNLYAYVHNSPLLYWDEFGLYANSDSIGYPSYHDDLYAYPNNDPVNFNGTENRFASAYQTAAHSLNSFLSDHRVQGGMRAFGGLTEAAFGMCGGIATAPSGIGLVGGGLIMAHGIDNFVAGCYQAFNGRRKDPATVQLLQSAGMSHESAYLINDALGVAGSFGGATANRLGQASYRAMPSLASTKFMPGEGMDLPKANLNLIPEKFFGSKTYAEMETLLTNKFGPPKGVGLYNKSFFNPKTERTFNLHWDPSHRAGKPHIDIRKRGLDNSYYKNRPFFLLEE